MTTISIENVQSLVVGYFLQVTRTYGTDGERALVELLNHVKLLFQRCPPEKVQAQLTILRTIYTSPSHPLLAQYGAPSKSSTFVEAGAVIAECSRGDHVFIEVKDNGTLFLLTLDADMDLQKLGVDIIAYRYREGIERIGIKDAEFNIPKVALTAKSNFAVPTFDNLDDALNHYREFATKAQCLILAEVWEEGVDGPRLVLKNKPERIMRNSLYQSLRQVLRDADVRREHNTDDTKPVDIRIEWFASSSSALIEVKWLGRSMAAAKSTGPKRYTDYGPSRAQQGASQLADYLEREITSSTLSTPKGYLVVFDARRRGVKGPSDRLSADNAMYFATKEVAYDPNYSALRNDFATPIRYFMNPRKDLFALT
jgi:hypothetical protein